MPVPWLRAEPFFFGVGGVADNILLGVVPPPLTGEEPASPIPSYRLDVPVDPYPAAGFEDASFMRSLLDSRRR
jgi:hypothetical protein